MNYKKGFFRITIVFSTISTLFGLIIGINQFSYKYEKYDNSLKLYKSYRTDMLNLLDNNNNIIDTVHNNHKTLVGEVLEQLELENIEQAEKFKIKKGIIRDFNLNNINDTEYLSIKEIIDNGINKKIDEKIKNKIADEFADASVDTSFPLGSALVYLLLVPFVFGFVIWTIYYLFNFIVTGFIN